MIKGFESGTQMDMELWEHNLSNKKDYVTYTGQPVDIVVDTDLNFIGFGVQADLKKKATKTLTVKNMLELTEGHGGILFQWINENEVECSHYLKCTRCNDNLELVFWTCGDTCSNIKMKHTELHPLHAKYGLNGLKLDKIIYGNKSSISVGDSYYTIVQLEFTVKDTGEKLIMPIKELIYNMLISTDIKDEEFYNNSIFKYLEFQDNMVPAFEMNRRRLERERNNENSWLYGVEIEESSNKISVRNWLNKMALLGYEVKSTSNETNLIKILQLDKTLNKDKTLVIPEFLYVNPWAFNRLPIREIRIKSPYTILKPFENYKNKYDKEIRINYVYDKSLDRREYFNNLFSILYSERKLGYHDQSNSAWFEHKMTINIPLSEEAETQ